jgi:hypothetical protein
MLGYSNPIIEAWNPPVTTSYTDARWKSGDAILYSTAVAPILTGRQTKDDVITITVDSGMNDPAQAGRVMEMNNFNYPNRLISVLNGRGSAGNIKLPFRCSNLDFSENEVFTWT